MTDITNSDAVPVPSNYLICDLTGFKIKRKFGLHHQWDGHMVRADSWSARNAQQHVKAKAELLPGALRPESTDRFIEDLFPNDVQASDL